MELNLNRSLGSNGHKAKASIHPKDVSSRPLIAMSPWDQRPCLFLTSLNVVLRDGENSPWILENFLFFTFSLHVSFDSKCSWLISASKDYLKSKFYWKRKENSHLELQTSSSEPRNEKPCIRRLIGSFRRLIWVILRVFILIFHHLVIILHFES